MSYFYHTNEFKLDNIFYDDNRSIASDDYINKGDFSPIKQYQITTPQGGDNDILFEQNNTPDSLFYQEYTPGNPDEIQQQAPDAPVYDQDAQSASRDQLTPDGNCQNELFVKQVIETPEGPDENVPQQSPIENFLAQIEPAVTEMTFSKEDENFKTNQYEGNSDIIPFDSDVYFKNFIDKDFEPLQPSKPKTFKIHIEIDSDIECNSREPSEKSNSEERASLTTKDDTFAGCSPKLNNLDQSCSESILGESCVDMNIEWREKVEEFLLTRSDEERAYIQEILPTLLETIKEASSMYSPSINSQLMETICKNLLYGKEVILGMEHKHLSKMVKYEMNDIEVMRPQSMINYDDLVENKRKVKKSTKGHKNGSQVNHLNENYVSNIFQFAKQNHPEDKEIYKIANTRNVSANNFRKLTRLKMDDTLLVRKAKVRILNCGKELVNNVEYWMNDGYFGQCTEKEKYINNKEKALTDLVLDREY